jgi:hypothetical protein
MSADSLFDRAEQAVRQGKLWRAKEALQGGIRARGYDQELFERLGLVLLQMGDLVEAGRYLFLSGRRTPSYEDSISLYLRRFARANPLQLYRTFPRAARLKNRQDYPSPLNTELERLGVPEELPAPLRKSPGEKPGGTNGKFVGNLVSYGCLAIIVVILGFAGLGIASIVQWFRA